MCTRIIIITLLITSHIRSIAQPAIPVEAFHSVNTPYDEQSPVLTPDGKTLYLTLRNHPQNIDGKRDPGDIWFATRVDDHWSELVHAGSVINDRAYNAVAGFSWDGTKMYLLSHYDDSGTARTQGISVSQKSSVGWSKPKNIFIPYFQNKSSIQSGHASANESIFIYSAETYGSYGVDDLYVSVKGEDGKWSEPKNLGSKINTQFQEVSPSLSADGKTLYFSSNGRRGSGSFDIFSCSRLDDTFTNWSEPVNLGREINSDGRELDYKTFEQLGLSLFTSTKNSDGYGDVKVSLIKKSMPDSAMFVNQIPQQIETTAEVIVQPEVNENDVRIYGKVSNARNGEPVAAKISFSAPDIMIPIEVTLSGYSVVVPRNFNYAVDVEANGFISSLEKINLRDFEMKELEMNFNLQPIAVGTTVNLKNVLFIQSKPELLPESYPELDLVVAFMKANPHIEIELAGHTDDRGSYRQLLALSQKRVNRVKDYLVSKGIDKKRITGKGYGGSKPIASNDTEEQRMLNRRVEFIIKKL